MEYVEFAPAHIGGIIRLTNAEGWPTLAGDADRAVRVLTAPGVVTVVALQDGEVGGFARALSDGEWVACLTDIAVDVQYRRLGVGRELIQELFARTGAQRMDLLCEPGAEEFYRSFLHQQWVGFRLYPPGADAS